MRGPVPTARQRLEHAINIFGHEVHLVRRREVRWLTRALGDLRGRKIADIAGGDGYWAWKLERGGAHVTAIDFDLGKLQRGRRLPDPPDVVMGDAERLPLPDASVDAAILVCAIEHFDAPDAALDELARVVRPGGRLVLSADALTRAGDWPALFERHRERYHVANTFDHGRLGELLEARGFTIIEHDYLFRSRQAQRLYLQCQRGRLVPNLLAPLDLLVEQLDKRSEADGGAVLLLAAERRAS